MKTLYIECNMGAAGDMLMAALSEIIDNPDKIIEDINSLGIHGVKVAREKAIRCGVTGTHMRVDIHGHEEDDHHHDRRGHEDPHSPYSQGNLPGAGHKHEDDDHHHDHRGHEDPHGPYVQGEIHKKQETHSHSHSHSSLSDIAGLINGLDVSDNVKKNAAAVYRIIADAEAKVHGTSVDLVHFHEVGALDAVVDVVGVCMMMEQLSPDTIVVSPVHVGSGSVKSAHGILPVPAPATAEILKGIPSYGGDVDGELCTPTGAALLKHFATSFGKMPAMTVSGIGAGMGKKDFPARPNCVRAFCGTASENYNSTNGAVTELRCNIDDMTAEALSYAAEVFLKEGAVDVSVQPVFMKKNRAGFLLTVMCKDSDADKMAALILKNTSAIGVRRIDCSRYEMDRETREIKTSFGVVRAKYSKGYGAEKIKPECDDILEIARKNSLTFEEVYEAVNKCLE